MRNFVGGENKKDHLVNWGEVIKNWAAVMMVRNKALLGMWPWRFPLEVDSMQSSIRSIVPC